MCRIAMYCVGVQVNSITHKQSINTSRYKKIRELNNPYYIHPSRANLHIVQERGKKSRDVKRYDSGEKANHHSVR
jgi:hypothetical protein